MAHADRHSPVSDEPRRTSPPRMASRISCPRRNRCWACGSWVPAATSRTGSSATTTSSALTGSTRNGSSIGPGIHERRFALPHQATSDLCTQAAIRCLQGRRPRAGRRRPAGLATFTPDMAFPSTANLVQDRLKLDCPAFDVQAACAGFVFALVIAAQFVGDRQQPMCPGHRRRLQQPGHQPGRPEELPALRRRRRRGPAGAGRARSGAGRLSARLRRLRRRPAEPAGLRQPDPAVGRGAREGAALPHHGRPGRLQVGRAHPGRFVARPCWPTPTARSTTSAGSSPTRPTSGSSTRPATCWVPSRRGLQEPRAVRQHLGRLDPHRPRRALSAGRHPAAATSC